MQTQTFETSRGTLLAIRLPDGSTKVEIDDGDLCYYVMQHDTAMYYPLPPGDWKEIGLWGSVTEEKAKEVGCENLESLQSLLETGIKLRNPLGKRPPNAINGCYLSQLEIAEELNKWQAAEAEVWKHFYLIFKTK